MLENFGSTYSVTDSTPGSPEVTSDTQSCLFARYGGCTFNGGLYRVHTADWSRRASTMLAEAFPEFTFPLIPFGFDWLGRQFILDLRTKDTDPERS
ncbi:hypothetical protein [Paenarthrobacter nitroguajacolicus]|uniref:hypothetical protein n=1 Tax=Paenarthrobacter nitroguajacolicus TaxID=211146 RepID=UPI0028580BF5|nr:hypothetical protein [Paenarthrobacter nitroguajacolicus]MDR6636955.1 hypothetical protein [Paenarthrobacter nitroguajacolicus]